MKLALRSHITQLNGSWLKKISKADLSRTLNAFFYEQKSDSGVLIRQKIYSVFSFI